MKFLASTAAQESSKFAEGGSRSDAGLRELKEAERRQELLMDIMQKEVKHS